MPVPDGRYNPPMGQPPAPGFGSIDPVLTEVQRKRSATRKVSVAGSIIGLITMMIQIIFTTYELLTVNLRGEEYLGLALFAVLMLIAAPLRRRLRVDRDVHPRSYRLYSGEFPDASGSARWMDRGQVANVDAAGGEFRGGTSHPRHLCRLVLGGLVRVGSHISACRLRPGGGCDRSGVRVSAPHEQGAGPGGQRVSGPGNAASMICSRAR